MSSKYSKEISRTNPTAILFMVDQSSSMNDNLVNEGGAPKSKAVATADIINRFLQNLVLKCAKNEGVRDYFHVGIIGYGITTGPALSGPLGGRSLIPISEIANFPARIEERERKVDDGAGGLIETKVKFPIWLDPVANGGTPMLDAFARSEAIISDWVQSHPDSFPPIVLNVTDGEADGDLRAAAQSVRALGTSDGEALVFNVHLSANSPKSIAFPHLREALPDSFAETLFDCSSELTPTMRSYAQQKGLSPQAGAKGFVFNADLSALVAFIDIGTRPSNLR